MNFWGEEKEEREGLGGLYRGCGIVEMLLQKQQRQRRQHHCAHSDKYPCNQPTPLCIQSQFCVRGDNGTMHNEGEKVKTDWQSAEDHWTASTNDGKRREGIFIFDV